MEIRTGMLLYMLEDDRCYTIRQAVETLYDKKQEPRFFKKLYNRLNHFASNCSLTKSPDARVGKTGVCAWWGRTLKEQMGPKSYYRAQLNSELLNELRARAHEEKEESRSCDLAHELAEVRALARDLEYDAHAAFEWAHSLEREIATADATSNRPDPRQEPLPSIDLEKAKTATPDPLENDHCKKRRPPPNPEGSRSKPSRSKSGNFSFLGGPWRISSKMTRVALLLLLSSVVIAYLKLKPLEQNAHALPIAVFPCLEDEMATALTDMVIQGLEYSETFAPVESARVARYRLSGCQTPNPDLLSDVAKALNVRFVLIGSTETSSSGYLYRGALFRNDGKRRAIQARGDHYRTLSDAVVRQCLAQVGSDEDPPSAVDLYSANSSASLMYSEGKIFFQKGNIAVARALFERAGSEYDPSFYMARNFWARCLEISGDLPKAREILEAIQAESPARITPPTLIQTYRFLASVYYENHETGKLSDLLIDASMLPLTLEDELYFLRVEAELRLIEGEPEQARILSEQARDLASTIDNQGARISTLMTASWVASRGGDLATGLGLLEEALSLAREHKLVSREIDLLGEKARLLIQVGDGPSIEAFVDVLTDAREMARALGNNWDGVKLDYWLGRLYGSLVREADEKDFLTLVAKDAESLGILEYEVKAKLLLIQIHIKNQSSAEAKRAIMTLQTRLPHFAPHFKLMILEEVATFYFRQEDYSETLWALDQKIELTAQLEQFQDLGRSLQNKGFVLETMDRLTEAETFYLESLELKSKHHDPTLDTTLKSLIRTYTKLGKMDMVNRYQTLLNKDR